jgi:Leucine-rich repeat (LRR) protein
VVWHTVSDGFAAPVACHLSEKQPTGCPAGVHLVGLTSAAHGVSVSGTDLLSRLTSLDLSRCRIEADAVELLATSAKSLQNLSLAETAGISSFTDIRPLQQLSRLTKLDLSSPAPSLRFPSGDITAVCELTQLRHLVLNEVLSRW